MGRKLCISPPLGRPRLNKKGISQYFTNLLSLNPKSTQPKILKASFEFLDSSNHFSGLNQGANKPRKIGVCVLELSLDRGAFLLGF